MSRPLVIFHKGCFDGTASALVAYLVFGEDADYLPLSYADQPPQPSQVVGRDVYLIDFSFKPPVMGSLVAASKSFTWLDHHKSAKEELGAFVASQFPGMTYRDGQFGANIDFGQGLTNYGYFDGPQDAIKRTRFILDEAAGAHVGFSVGDEYEHRTLQRKFRCVVDMERSGATIAFGHFFPGWDVPDFFKMVEDRDLWRNTLPGVEEFHSYLFTLGFDDPRLWHEAVGEDETVADLIEKGRVARAAKKMDIELALRYSGDILFEGYHARAVNFCLHQGDVGHELVKLSGDGVGVLWWWDESKDSYIVSLRSSDESGVDVAKIAQRYGGGGHIHASGFQCMELPW